MLAREGSGRFGDAALAVVDLQAGLITIVFVRPSRSMQDWSATKYDVNLVRRLRMKFTDFHRGMHIEAGPYVVVEEELLDFARKFDPQWFHTDAERADDGPFGGIIASGWHTCAIAMRMIVESALHDSESFASPGLRYVKWQVPVFPGDELSLKAEVLDVRRSATRSTLGILSWRWQLFNQHAINVLDLEATSLFKLEPAETE